MSKKCQCVRINFNFHVTVVHSIIWSCLAHIWQAKRYIKYISMVSWVTLVVFVYFLLLFLIVAYYLSTLGRFLSFDVLIKIWNNDLLLNYTISIASCSLHLLLTLAKMNR